MPNNQLLPSQHFDTDNLAEGNRFHAWSELSKIIEQPELHQAKDSEQFYAKATGYMLGSLSFVYTESIAQNFIRSAEQVAASSLDHVYITVFLNTDFDLQTQDKRLTVGAGNPVLIDLNQSYKMLLPNSDQRYQNIMVLVPRAKLAALLPKIDFLHSAVLESNNTMHPLLTNFITTLKDSIADFSISQGEQTSQALLALIAACFTSSEQQEQAKLHQKSNLFPAIKNYIYQSIGTQELSPSLIAQEFHISLSTLTRICRQFGGVSKIIKRCRLLKAYKLIQQKQQMTIQQISFAVGFNNQDTFTRAFKKEFGLLPSQIKTSTANTSEQVAQAQHTIKRWNDWADYYIS